MFAASLALQGLAARTGAPDVSTGIEAVIGELDDAIAEIRGAIFTLHRPALDRNMPGVRVRILKVAARLADVLAFTPSLTFSGPVEEVASEEITEHLLAVVGEALSNIARHARLGRRAEPVRGRDRSPDACRGPEPARVGQRRRLALTQAHHRRRVGPASAPSQKWGVLR